MRPHSFFLWFALSLTVISFTLLSQEASADIGDNSLGMNTHIPSDGELDLVRELGVNWIRVDANWFSMEPARGRFEWREMDRVVNSARARELSVFMTLSYSPSWVPRSNDGGDGTPHDDEIAGSTEWSAFVTEAVRHFRALGVTHFGLWNEPNLEQFWDGTADTFVDRVLLPGSAAVRSACSDCVVLGPDLAHLRGYDDFLRVVMRRASGSFDIFAHHIYKDWPENGHSAFDGDSFINALEMRRAFGRASMREVLDEFGYTGEVWITETGYRANPPGSASEERAQDIYIRRVMEEQLERSWWTNTFFYESVDCGIDIPGCGIDGFGITRPLRGNPRAWPADYRKKPAYNRIQAFVREHPEIVAGMSEGPAACADGRDNDGDGRVDLDDPGCSSAADDDETDPPMAKEILATRGSATIDGDLSEYSGFVELTAADFREGAAPSGAGDLSARIAARYDVGRLMIAVEVRDDVHENSEPDERLWAADSVQIAFDMRRDGGAPYDDENDHEFAYALVGGSSRGARFHGPSSASGVGDVVITRAGDRTRYEIALDTAQLSPGRVRPGDVIGFSFLVNENDGAGRDGWLEWTPGIGSGKNPGAFGTITLLTAPPPTDAGTDSGTSDAGTDGGLTDAGGTDSGTDGGRADSGGTDSGETDSGETDGGGIDPRGDDGCECTTAGASGTPLSLGWFLVLGIAFARRRIRR